MKTHTSFLGGYLCTQKPCDAQRMIFSLVSDGSFWMSQEEQIAQNYDCTISKTNTMNLTKKKLLVFLKEI